MAVVLQERVTWVTYIGTGCSTHTVNRVKTVTVYVFQDGTVVIRGKGVSSMTGCAVSGWDAVCCRYC